MYAAERRQQIYQLVREQGSASVNELAERFGVSRATLRSDLSALDAEGLLTRTHGGAIPREGSLDALVDRMKLEAALADRSNREEKQRIGAAAVELVDEGDYLLLDNGTTAQAFAEQLAASPLENVTVYTTDLIALASLETNPRIAANVLPGRIRSGFHYSYGDETIAALQDAHFTKLVVATSGFDIENGLTVVQPHLASLKRTMVRASKEVILICDSSKIGETRFQKFADLSEVDVMITDSGANDKVRSTIEANVAQLIVV